MKFTKRKITNDYKNTKKLFFQTITIIVALIPDDSNGTWIETKYNGTFHYQVELKSLDLLRKMVDEFNGFIFVRVNGYRF